MLRERRALRPWSIERWLDDHHSDPVGRGFPRLGPGGTISFRCPRASVPPLSKPESTAPRLSRDFWDFWDTTPARKIVALNRPAFVFAVRGRARINPPVALHELDPRSARQEARNLFSLRVLSRYFSPRHLLFLVAECKYTPALASRIASPMELEDGG